MARERGRESVPADEGRRPPSKSATEAVERRAGLVESGATTIARDEMYWFQLIEEGGGGVGVGAGAWDDDEGETCEAGLRELRSSLGKKPASDSDASAFEDLSSGMPRSVAEEEDAGLRRPYFSSQSSSCAVERVLAERDVLFSSSVR